MTKTDFDTKMSSLNRKIISKKSKHLHVENELRKLKTFDSIYYRGKIYCEKDGTQNYLVFQAVNKYFKVIAGTIYVSYGNLESCLMKYYSSNTIIDLTKN